MARKWDNALIAAIDEAGENISMQIGMWLSTITPIGILYGIVISFPFFDFNNIGWLNIAKHVGYRLLVLVVVFATAFHLSTRRTSPGYLRTGLEWPFVIYFATIANSIFVSRFELVAPLWEKLAEVASLALLCCFFFSAIYWIRSRDAVRRMTWYLLVTGFAISCFAMVQQIMGVDSLFRPSYRLAGIFWDPNIFARYELILLCFIIPMLFLARPRGKKRWYFVAFGLLALSGLLFSLSRSGYLTLLFIVMVYLIKSTPRKYIPLGLAIVAALSVAGYLYIVENRAQGGGLIIEASSLNRAALIIAGLGMIRDHWFAGIGYGNYPVALEQVYAGSSVVFSEAYKYARGISTNIHNWMIEVWAEQGILGLLAFILIFYVALRKLNRAIKSSPMPDDKAILTGYYLVLLVFLFHGFFYHVFITQFFFWVLFSMAMVAANVYENGGAEV